MKRNPRSSSREADAKELLAAFASLPRDWDPAYIEDVLKLPLVQGILKSPPQVQIAFIQLALARLDQEAAPYRSRTDLLLRHLLRCKLPFTEDDLVEMAEQCARARHLTLTLEAVADCVQQYVLKHKLSRRLAAAQEGLFEYKDPVRPNGASAGVDPSSVSDDVAAKRLLSALVKEAPSWSPRDRTSALQFAPAKQIRQSPPQMQIAFIRLAMDDARMPESVNRAMMCLLRCKLPFTEGDLTYMVERSKWLYMPSEKEALVRQVELYLQDREPTDHLCRALRGMAESLRSIGQASEMRLREWILKLIPRRPIQPIRRITKETP